MKRRKYYHYSEHPDRRSKKLERLESEEEEESESIEKRGYKKKKVWNEEAEHLLIQLWTEYIGSLRGSRKNHFVYQEISNEMVNEGHNFSVDEVRVKVHNMTNRYKLEKRNIEHRGGYSSWSYYDSIHSILNSDQKCEDLNNKEEEEEDPQGIPEPEEPDHNEESMCSIEAIESYIPTETENKEIRKRKKDCKSIPVNDILQMLRDNTEIMRKEAEDRRRTDARMLRLQEELLEIERERNDILKEILT